MKKRTNIDTIAEVLIDKLEEVKKLTEKLDLVSQKSLNVDTSKLEEEREKTEKSFKTFLSEYTIIENKIHEEQKKAEKGISEWRFYIIVILLFSVVLVCIGIYGMSKLNRANEIKKEAYNEGLIQGTKEGRSQILNNSSPKCKDYLINKFPDNEKTFWNYK